MSVVKPKVSKLLRKHLNGESDGREDVEAPIMRDPVPEWERRILCTVEQPRITQISERMQNTQESVVAKFKWFAGCRWVEGYGSPGPKLFDDGSLRPTRKWIQARQERESIYHLSHPEIAKWGVFENPVDTEGRDHKGSPRKVCGLTKECLVLDASRAIGRMSPGQSCPQGGCGVSRNSDPTGLVGSPHPVMAQNVGNVGPKSDHMERSDLTKRFFIARWERERAKREKQEGQGLKYPSVRLSMI
jgi:hypothetical protein